MIAVYVANNKGGTHENREGPDGGTCLRAPPGSGTLDAVVVDYVSLSVRVPNKEQEDI